MNDVINWLLEDGNPAVKYRTQTEILNQTADVSNAKAWIYDKIPQDWSTVKGLWYIYYVTALAECGLTKSDVSPEHLIRAFEIIEHNFEYGCADFMLLRALIMLGFGEHKDVKRVMESLQSNCLPDGGFLCQRRLKSFDYVPKSCYKANVFALLFQAECHKRKIDVDFGKSVTDYFFNRNIFYKTTDKSSVITECATRTFHPFEPMRVGIHNIVESFSALGYGNDERLLQAWSFLNVNKNGNGRMILSQTLTKSYLPKEKPEKESKWVTFYTLLAEKHRT